MVNSFLEKPSSAARMLWAALAALPFLSIYLVHYASPLGIPTGFIQGDMAYYSATAGRFSNAATA